MIVSGRRLALAAALLAAAITASFAGTRRLIDNRAVLVLENTYERGTRSGMHAHSNGRFVYVVDGGTLRVHLPAPKPEDGKAVTFGSLPRPVDVTLETGSAGWRPPERHALENVGSGIIRIIEVEIKRSGVSEGTAEDSLLSRNRGRTNKGGDGDSDGSVDPPIDDAVDLGPLDAPDGMEGAGELAASDGRDVLFRNQWGAIVHHRVGRGSEIRPYPAEGDRILYALTAGRFRYKASDGFMREIFRAPRDLKYHRAGSPPRGVNRENFVYEAVEFALEHSIPRRRMTIKGARVVPYDR